MAAGAGGLAWLIGAVITAVKARSGLALTTAGGLSVAGSIGELFHIDPLRAQAVRISPLSDPEALETAVRAIHWMMGVSDGDVIGPRELRNWNYFHYNPMKGQAWWTRTYSSSKSKRSSFRRGAGRGFGRGWNRARQTRELGR